MKLLRLKMEILNWEKADSISIEQKLSSYLKAQQLTVREVISPCLVFPANNIMCNTVT